MSAMNTTECTEQQQQCSVRGTVQCGECLVAASDGVRSEHSHTSTAAFCAGGCWSSGVDSEGML